MSNSTIFKLIYLIESNLFYVCEITFSEHLNYKNNIIKNIIRRKV